MDVKLHSSWKERLGEAFAAPAFASLAEFVRAEYVAKKVYPPPKCVFAALDAVPFEDVRVVILGQDPYHGPGQAHGLCFSVPDGVPKPPSLQNIFKEIHQDLGLPIPASGNLEHWAKQGVLLLNATLTVEAGQAGSHQGKGWEEFTDAVIRKLSEEREGIVFMLWGAYAQKKGAQIDRAKHLVLTAPHPSPLSAHNGFFGCRHFSKTNAYLVARGEAPIAWVKDAPDEIDVRDVSW
ncbi:MAG TPA: uracil-DNA glycosylase [Candidatus Baltobacteraceae bacterium]|nr:uracil-DNA glycosylase [Candidatus Baltobacteraceae bacterium]